MRLTFRQSVSVSRGLLSGIRFDVSLYSLVFQIDNVSIKVQKNVISGYFCQLKVNLATTFHAHSGQFQVYFTLSSRRKGFPLFSSGKPLATWRTSRAGIRRQAHVPPFPAPKSRGQGFLAIKTDMRSET